MTTELTSGLFALLGVLVGGLISGWLQRERNVHELAIHRENIKTEFMAEVTAQHYLSHKIHVDRSFELLRRRLGGFSDDELRKILVRAGAVRFIRDDGSEWWRLLSRLPEVIEKRRQQLSKDESEDA